VSEATLESSEKGGGKVRRWDAYVCPACRLVFRIPSDHDGKGVVCPSCRRLLKLPGEDDNVPPLVVHSGGDTAKAGGESDGGEVRKSRRRHRRHGEAVPDWESGAKAAGGGAGAEFRGIWLWVAFGVVLVLVVFGGLLRYFSSSGDGTGDVASGEEEVAMAPMEIRELGINMGDSETSVSAADDELARQVAGDPVEVLVGAESVARKFVAARSVEELLPLVRKRAEVEPKIRAWYRKHPFEDVKLDEFGVRRGVVFFNGLAMVVVRTSDFKDRNMVVEKTGDGFKVDWESWVGWSEMSWKQLREIRPTEPKLFRVFAKQGKYYNFVFFDDAEWRCYQLDSPDKKNFIFGYVKRRSKLDMELAKVGNVPIALTLMIRFPENAPADNQVFIDSIVADGWVIP